MLKLLVAGFGLLVGVAIVEVGVRVYELFDPEQARRLSELESPARGFPFESYASHPFLPYIGAPGYTARTFAVTPTGMVELEAVYNSFGFRSHELPTEKRDGDYLVIALGGSTTWGAATESNETTWPELLEGKLAARYPDKNVRVLNFGISAATSAYSIVTLSLIGVHVKPDLVIVYHGRNDPIPAGAPDYRPDHAHFFKDFEPRTAWRGYRRSLPSWMLRSHAIVAATSRLDDRDNVNGLYFHVTHPHVHYRNVVAPDAAEKLTANLLTIHSIAAGHGADVLFSTFQLYDPSVIPWPLNAALREFFAEHDLAYVDQDALIPDFDRSINYDDCHFTRAGRELVAQNFFDAIVERGYVDGAQPRTGSEKTE